MQALGRNDARAAGLRRVALSEWQAREAGQLPATPRPKLQCLGINFYFRDRPRGEPRLRRNLDRGIPQVIWRKLASPKWNFDQTTRRAFERIAKHSTPIGSGRIVLTTTDGGSACGSA